MLTTKNTSNNLETKKTNNDKKIPHNQSLLTKREGHTSLKVKLKL